MSKYDFEFANDPNSSHVKILNRIPNGARVLEFGCAHGVMSKYMSQEMGCEVYAVEIDKEAATDAALFCKKVAVCDIDSDEWESEYRNLRFDVIIFADVLEHLYDPWTALKRVKQYLKPTGSILISIPNIAHSAVIMELLNGRFDYRPTGLLDDTHIRFFTQKSLEEMIKACGFHATYKTGSFALPEHTEFVQSYDNFSDGVVEVLTLRENPHIYQYIYEIKLTELCDNRASTNFDEPIVPELFVDTGYGFNAQQMQQKYGERSGYFDLSGYENIQVLRFDPDCHKGWLHSYSFEYESLDGVIFPAEVLEMVGIRSGYVSHTNDPQIFLAKPEQPVVKLHYNIDYQRVYSDKAMLLVTFSSDDGILETKSLIMGLGLYRIDLSMKDDTTQLRLDPANIPANVKFHSATLITKDDTSVPLLMCHHNGTLQINGYYAFAHDDAQMYFDIPEQYRQHCQAVEFAFEVMPMSATEVQQVLSQALASKDAELSMLYASRSYRLARKLARLKGLFAGKKK